MDEESYFGKPDFRVEHFRTEAAKDHLCEIASKPLQPDDDGWILNRFEYRCTPAGLEGWAKWVRLVRTEPQK